jgi:hypothetical protein
MSGKDVEREVGSKSISPPVGEMSGRTEGVNGR